MLMLRCGRMGALALVLALALASAGVAQADPAVTAPAGNVFTLNGLFERVLDWLVDWGGGATTKEGTMIDPDGDLSPAGNTVGGEEGTMIDPNGFAAAGVCGDEGTMIDPDGNPCSP